MDQNSVLLCRDFDHSELTTDGHVSVLVDFEIDRQDLFRVNMGLSKWRLLIGVVVVLTLGISLTCFFIMIDEEMVLLKTSLFFIGLPLVALGGQVLRLHAFSKKYVAGLAPSQRHVQYMFQSSSDGYDVATGESFSHVVWNDVRQVVEKTRHFLIYLNDFEIRILPKRGFQQTDIPVFRKIVQDQLGSHAKLLAA